MEIPRIELIVESPCKSNSNKVGKKQSLNDIGWAQFVSEKDNFTCFLFAGFDPLQSKQCERS